MLFAVSFLLPKDSLIMHQYLDQVFFTLVELT